MCSTFFLGSAFSQVWKNTCQLLEVSSSVSLIHSAVSCEPARAEVGLVLSASFLQSCCSPGWASPFKCQSSQIKCGELLCPTVTYLGKELLIVIYSLTTSYLKSHPPLKLFISIVLWLIFRDKNKLQIIFTPCATHIWFFNLVNYYMSKMSSWN